MSTFHAKIDNICRLCLSGGDNLESIFGDSGSEALQNIIFDCTSVKVSRRLGHPTAICGLCKIKVESFHQFREQCIQNDELLRSTFLEPEVVIKTEPDLVLPTAEEEEYEEDDDDDYDDINEADIDEWDESESNEGMQLDTPSIVGDISMNADILFDSGIGIAQDNPLDVPMFKCELCFVEFISLEQLEKHITSHKEEKIFKCFYCPKTFHFAKNLNMHVEYIHSKMKYTQRSSTAFQGSSLAQNRLVSNEKGTTLQKTTSTISNINNNVKTTRRNGNPTQPQLQLVAALMSSRSPPVAAHPCRTTSSNHECHVCHKSFNDLRQHMLLHDGEKPYKCDICSKSFFNASTLKTHYRVHSDENPFRCNTCTKVFDNARSLELHYRTHTGERPYACDVCLKKFSCSSNLKRHRKLHDRD
ncbi:histone-lysine N-methyltransferase MECOM-like [Uranotaenia lowii]|uniref:histone-lysine N-methyltransferase MECOM-like n=1 Tax=Uranotaenia lowii TaxID=190385 RepID=UPI0024785088|nr:histone-lysine N-methyltransferase MECOM-like [Uranotaenia lowii]